MEYYYAYIEKCPFNVLQGEVLSAVDGLEKESTEVIFECVSGETYRLAHDRDCCETVDIEDVCGDVEDLVGNPLLLAEEVSNYDHPFPSRVDVGEWTFYKLATCKGNVTIRWLGNSDSAGYSMRVQLDRVVWKEREPYVPPRPSPPPPSPLDPMAGVSYL
jgi:hypothetical protein